MKKLLLALLTTLVLLVGCSTIPTQQSMFSIAQSIGYSSAMIANETSIDDKSREAILNILNIVTTVVPTTNSTFNATWVPVAQMHASNMVAEGKLTTQQATLVVSGVTVIAMGVDYMFTVYPEAKEYQELTAAAIDGFASGFTTVFIKKTTAPRTMYIPYDEKAYEALKKMMRGIDFPKT